MHKKFSDNIPLPSIEQIESERIRIRKKRQYKKAFVSTINVLLVVAAVAVLVATLFLSILQVSGTSMEPTLEDGDIIAMINTNKFETGDLVGLHYNGKVLLKRVIGVPGNYINIDKDGTVYVDGVAIDEPYVVKKSLGECDIKFPYQVPEGTCFVLGDHRDVSIDSRSSAVGCIKYEQIIGRVVIRIWPLKEISFVK